MPLDTGLLYGEMVGSAFAHAAIPIGAILIIRALRDVIPPQTSLIFLAICISLSFLAQMAFLMILQANACSGIKNFVGIAHGALIAALITGGMVSIPIFIEPMRFMVSQLFIDHKILLTPELQKLYDTTAQAGVDIMSISKPEGDVLKPSGSIDKEGYEDQTLSELSAGSSYWSAFAGAYGVAFGSLMAATCPSVGGASGP